MDNLEDNLTQKNHGLKSMPQMCRNWVGKAQPRTKVRATISL